MKRAAIIGTAQSLSQTPWKDESLECWGLNDAYQLHVPRANRWFDLHPTHQMAFRPRGDRAVSAFDVPVGSYLRPADHLDWLKSRGFPVYLAEAHPDWPTARVFPKDEILAFFQPFWPYRLTRQGTVEAGKDYETSTPAWMLMQAIVEGYDEIHVYGIHLATEWEYLQQRPNFEWLLGFAAGRGIKIVLPQSTPICQAKFRYAFEPKADIPLQTVHLQIQAVKARGQKLQQAKAATRWYDRSRRKDLDHALAHLDVELLDLRQQAARAQAALAA